MRKLSPRAFFLLQATRASLRSPPTECGRSSGVEHNLAKVRVVSSNLIARSKTTEYPRLVRQGRLLAAFLFWARGLHCGFQRRGVAACNRVVPT